MLRDYRNQGSRGEHLAIAFLLQFFEDISKPEPDNGIDLIGRLRLKYRARPEIIIHFNFQVKTGKEFKVNCRTFRRWPKDEPFILFHVNIISPRHQKYSYKLLNDWKLENVSWPDLEKDDGKISFNRKLFIQIDDSASKFLLDLKNEENRVLGLSGSPTITIRSMHLPLNESDLFKHIQVIPKIEVPANVLREIDLKNQFANEAQKWDYLHDLWRSDYPFNQISSEYKYTIRWLSKLDLKPNPIATAQGRMELRNFISTLLAAYSGQPFNLPLFNFQTINKWRVFVGIYPESINIFRNIFAKPSNWTSQEIKSSFTLLSTLVYEDDHVVSNRAMDLLSKLDDNYDFKIVQNFEEYSIVRQYLYVRAEADGNKDSVNKCLDFINYYNKTITGGVDWELLIHRLYYQSNDTATAQSFRNKFELPKIRDENARKINQMIFDRLPNNLK